MTDVTTSPTVSLTVPCTPEFLSMIRLVASSVASSAGFDVDDIDDLRIAADELCYLLMSASAEDHDLHMSFTTSTRRVVMEGSRSGWPEGGVLPGASELMVKILAQVVDDFEITGAEGAVSFRAVKDASTAGSGSAG